MTLTSTKYIAATRLLIFIITLFASMQIEAANRFELLDMPGGFPLIKDASQFFTPFDSKSGNAADENYMGSKLIDRNIQTYWRSLLSTNEYKWNDNKFFCIDLRKNVKNKDLVFQLMFAGNTTSKEKTNPKEITLYYSNDGETWIKHGVFDLNYHGPTGTDYTQSDIYSIRQGEFKISADAQFIKIEVTASRSTDNDAEKNKTFSLSEFQIYETLGHGAASALIYRAGQLSTNGWGTGNKGDINNLLDNITQNPHFNSSISPTFWQSKNYMGTPLYLQVTLNGRVNPDENLQLIIRRPWNIPEDQLAHPKKLKVQVSATGGADSWVDSGYLEFDYPDDHRNNNKWQASKLFKPAIAGKYLRFICEESYNPTGKSEQSKQFSYDEFRLYRTDREDLIREFTPNDIAFEDTKTLEKGGQFKHTHGILDQRNHWSELLYDYSNWDNWKDGKWQEDEDAALLKQHNIQMPDYSYINGIDTIEGHPIELDGDRQRAHTLYHIVYALPGQHLNLTSFSGFKDIKGDYYYMENYIRWYDYKTDKKSDRLKFMNGDKEEAMINIANAGHFAGKEFGLDRSVGTIATYCVPTDGITQDEWIAVDYAQNCSMASGRNFDSENNIFYEPRIAFRHIFHIVDGRKFVEENMTTHADNDKYARANRRHVTARAGKEFQIRFDNITAADKTTFGAYPYKKGSGYDYVREPKIKVYDQNGITENTNIKFGFKVREDYTEHGFTIDGKTYPDSKYHRALYCDANNAIRGKYLVRVVGCDETGTEIKVDGQNLILQEYLIEFVSENEASYVQSEYIPYNHQQKTLTAAYGDPIATVNFDNYRHLVNAKHPENYFTNTLYSEHHYRMYPDGTDGYSKPIEGDYRFKWPLPWGQSNYSYMYGSGFDFNMYTITNSFELVPFNEGARTLYKADGKTPESQVKRFQDRRSIDNNGTSRGFMYYVNASQDPGEMVQIPVENLCPGSTLFVSGWVNEQSGHGYIDGDVTPEMANLIVSMQRIDKDGKEQTLHSFVTGYQEDGTYGQWHHFYYSVVLNYDEFGLSIDPDAKFRIILENNSLSSHGADYAVDDIRVWVAQPSFQATQMIPLCRETSATTVQVKVPFDVMLASIDKEAAKSADENETYKFFYTFLRKGIYDKMRDEGNSYEEAFDAAIMPYAYMSNVKDEEGNAKEDQKYGWVNFNTYYDLNPAAKNGTPGEDQMASYRITMNGDQKWLVFNTDPRGEMHAGDWLIIAVKPETEYPQIVHEDGTKEDYKLCNVFDLETKCAIRKDFLLKSSAIIRVNGDIVEPDAVTACVNQAPVITLDVNNKEGENLGYTQPFDWFDGPMSTQEVNGQTIIGYTDMEKDGLSLHEVMFNFREEYRNATSLDGVTAKDSFTQPMLDWLKELATPDPKTKRPKIYINKVSFAFPNTTVPEGYENSILYVTGIPINRYEGGTEQICVEPTEVRLVVKNHAPELLHGFHESMITGTLEYPDWMQDVPLRIGLDQISKVSYENVSGVTNGNSLKLPIRFVKTVSKGSKKMVVPYSDNLNDIIYLAETDDYEILEGKQLEGNQLIEVGRLMYMKAVTGEDDNYINVIFNNKFTFKEGCYYILQFSYEEDEPEQDENDMNVYCNGQHLITLKVVPKYVKWTGEVNRNWANDDNWRRVTATDLKLATDAKAKFDKYINDGTANTTVKSYAPLDFTHVIIENSDGEGNDKTNVRAIKAFETSKMATINYNNTSYDVIDVPELNEGEATLGINYEMAATDVSTGVSCRPWYTHTAKAMHFGAHTTVTGQQYLTYEKAWADFELAHTNWRICSSPFQETVAGDFYLPTASARQETQLFEPITYDKNVNDRFQPAVFQRAWNHNGSANIYKLNPDDNSVSVEDAADTEAVGFAWSNVYNDVKEDYGKGNAYAIKADIAKVTNKPQEVLFRLPKDDKKFFYYNFEDTKNETHGFDNITRTANNYQLNPIEGTLKVESRGKSTFFMVGNPLLCYMDVKQLISQYNASNPSVKLTNKYYFIDSNGAHHIIWDGDATESGQPEISNLKADVAPMLAGYVPPFTAFFLETEEEVKSIEVGYNSSMAVDEDEVYATGLLGTRADGSQSIRIEAYRNGEYQSDAVLRYVQGASEEYVSSEDMAMLADKELLGDRVQVFTTSGKLAAAINSVPEGSTVRLGVISPDNGETTICFDGDIQSGLFLYDAFTDTKEEIEQGTKFTVTGSTSGRYFITNEMLNEDINTFTIVARGNKVTVTAPGEGEMLINVYDMVGRRIYSYTTGEYDHSFELDNGIFVVDVRRDGKRHSEKIIIK